MSKGNSTIETAKALFDGYGSETIISKAEIPIFIKRINRLSIIASYR